MKHITCIEDLRQVHMRKVPKAFFDYADRGSYAEETLRANRDDLQQIKFRQRVLVDVSKRDLSTTILGEPASLPLILAPVGLTGMQYGDGEIHACRAAQADRRQDQRQRCRLTEDGGREIAFRHVHQNALAKLDLLKIIAIGAQRFLRIGTAIGVVEKRLRHFAHVDLAQILDAGDVFHGRSRPFL